MQGEYQGSVIAPVHNRESVIGRCPEARVSAEAGTVLVPRPAHRTLAALRDRLVSAPGSVGERRRLKRWEWLAATFPDIASMNVLDLGGTVTSWMRAPVRPAGVHVVNLLPEDDGNLPWIRTSQGDACDLQPTARGHYDLVYSNSVLEHVGGHHQRERFAETVYAMAPAHWVQAPYRYFPVEPHWLFPGFQFLPPAARALVAMHWPLAARRPKDRVSALQSALGIELPTKSEMSLYFPGSEIRVERMLGLPKSLIAVRA
jgi:hypothetical protein